MKQSQQLALRAAPQVLESSHRRERYATLFLALVPKVIPDIHAGRYLRKLFATLLREPRLWRYSHQPSRDKHSWHLTLELSGARFLRVRLDELLGTSAVDLHARHPHLQPPCYFFLWTQLLR